MLVRARMSQQSNKPETDHCQARAVFTHGRERIHRARPHFVGRASAWVANKIDQHRQNSKVRQYRLIQWIGKAVFDLRVAVVGRQTDERGMRTTIARLCRRVRYLANVKGVTSCAIVVCAISHAASNVLLAC